MRRVRQRVWVVLALVVVASACAATAELPNDAAAPISPDQSSQPVEGSEPASQGGQPSGQQVLATPDPSDQNAELPAEPVPPTFYDLEELAAAGEITELEIALTGFALVFGDIEGALEVTIDESVPHEATSIVDQLRVLDSQLSEQQRSRIDAVLAEIEADAVLVYTSGDGETEGVPGSSAGPSEGDESIFEPGVPHGGLSESEANAIAQEAENYLAARLGGTRPAVSLSLIAPENRVGEERGWDGWASTRADSAGARRCAIVVNNDVGYSLRGLRATIAHELFHCWHAQNNGSTLQQYWRTRNWVTEGLATWVADEFVGGSVKGRIRANQFLNQVIGKLYFASYAAVGFYWQVNDLDGTPDGMWARIPAIARATGSSDAFEAATVGLTLSQMAELASSGTQTEAWGPEWTVDGRPMGTGARRIREIAATGPTLQRAGEGDQNVPALVFEFAGEDSWVVDITRTGLTIAGWNAGPTFDKNTTSDTTQWCVQGDCLCEDGRNLFPQAQPVPGGDPTYIVALSGIPDQAATVSSKPQNVEEACSAEDVPTHELAGVWVAEPAAIIDAYAKVYAGIDIGVVGASGQMSMILYPDFRAEIRYDQVSLSLDSPILDQIIIDGSGKLNWRIEGDELEFFGWANFMLEVLAPAVSPDPIRVSSADIEAVNGTLTFDFVRDRSELALTNIRGSEASPDAGAAGTLVFPEAWFRIGDAPNG